jgi:hypothetical protein
MPQGKTAHGMGTITYKSSFAALIELDCGGEYPVAYDEFIPDMARLQGKRLKVCMDILSAYDMKIIKEVSTALRVWF